MILSILIYAVVSFITYMIFETKGPKFVFAFNVIYNLGSYLIQGIVSFPVVLIGIISALILTAIESFVYNLVTSFSGFFIINVILQFILGFIISAIAVSFIVL